MVRVPGGGGGSVPGPDIAVLSPQKPILLQGHERSITQIKYNREGDLLFTVAKDPVSSGGGRAGAAEGRKEQASLSRGRWPYRTPKTARVTATGGPS